MKGFFKKIFKKDKGGNADSSAAQDEESKTAEAPQ